MIILLLIIVFVLVEWMGRESLYAIENIGSWQKQYKKWLVYILIIFLILLFTGNQQEFIYFQF